MAISFGVSHRSWLQVSAAPVLAQLAPVTSQSTLGKTPSVFFLKAGSLTFGSGLVIVSVP